MTDDKPTADSVGEVGEDDAETLVRSIAGVVERLRDLQRLAREQGIFVADAQTPATTGQEARKPRPLPAGAPVKRRGATGWSPR